MIINNYIAKSNKFEVYTEIRDSGVMNVTIETFDNVTIGMNEDQVKTLAKALYALLKGEDRPQPKREWKKKGSSSASARKEEKDPWDE